MNNSVLKKKNISQYRFGEFGEKGTLLEYQGRLLFIIGSKADLRGDFMVRLIDLLNRDKGVIPEHISRSYTRK